MDLERHLSAVLTQRHNGSYLVAVSEHKVSSASQPGITPMFKKKEERKKRKVLSPFS